ncbi:transcription-silencing protein Clr2-domain-containing protein [Talaromyces proteolyticus]|uniref:Transcription-silencing protein Clr2-domain-containing protein n=1 Tax=Talaromyces proteolyticus TaxID=1131652 RepID=A0AAD4KWL4_9EURO|nr:transcription-silencing protein Clr2-domain-containing protein [Talaromyces proteolyticus]KAH8700562.1 transcription-silencing protein Clr2-domain-containing protein [Talaromyces proteolyticus]
MASSEYDTVEVVSLPPKHFGDGSKNAWPKEHYWEVVSDVLYRQKLATMWIQKTGKLVKGKQYVLDRMPDDYALLQRPGFTDPTARAKFLYGHPSGGYYNSPNQFFTHFNWLMSGGLDSCPCECCKKLKQPGTRLTPGLTQSSRGRPLKVPKTGPPTSPMDSEGIPDVFREAIIRLKQVGEMDESIREPQSMDWRAENKLLREQIVRLGLQSSYIPRVGEVVLWIPQMGGELRYDDESGTHRIYSTKDSRFKNIPEWRAGIIGETPDKDPVVLEDLIESTPKQWAVNYSGFRVETFPDPNSDEKSALLQYKYVHIHAIRSFYSWPIYLKGVPQESWHPSIKHAMTIMSSLSLIDRYHFKGKWPNASVYCRGMFIGPEMIIVGDAVRLKPKGARLDRDLPNVTDVMVIDRIEFKLISCIDDQQSSLLAEKHALRVRGKVYSVSPTKAYRKPNEYAPLPLSRQQVINAFQQAGMTEYGPWYQTHKFGTSVEVSQDMIIGRCFEPPAMELLFGNLFLGFDLYGMLASRDWSRRSDNRMLEGQDWFWADYRTQALAIDTLNGEDVGRYSDARDCKMWKGVLNIIDGNASQHDYEIAKLPRTAGRPSIKAKSRFSKVQKMSSLVSSGLHMDTSANVSSTDDSGEGSSDEDGDQTMAIHHATYTYDRTNEGDEIEDRDINDHARRASFPIHLPIRGTSESPRTGQLKRPRIVL